MRALNAINLYFLSRNMCLMRRNLELDTYYEENRMKKLNKKRSYF